MVSADHIDDTVILRNESFDIIARMDPESAIDLAKSLLNVSDRALLATREDV